MIGRLAPEITDASRNNLEQLARLHPADGRILFKRLRECGPELKKLVVSQSYVENHSQDLAEGVHLVPDEKGGLRLCGRAGDARPARNKPFRGPTLVDYGRQLFEFKKEFAADEELGYLFLYSAIWRARAEVYAAGEFRSKGIKLNQPEMVARADRRLAKIAEFIDYYRRVYPFGATAGPDRLAGRLGTAARLLKAKGQNVMADNSLRALTDVLEKSLRAMVNQRLVVNEKTVRAEPAGPVHNGINGKFRYKDGRWTVRQVVNHTTDSGLIQEMMGNKHVTTDMLSSMMRHEVERVGAEPGRNDRLIARLNDLESSMPGAENKDLGFDGFDLLYDLHDEFDNFSAWNKQNAFDRIVASMHLVLVGTKQAEGLAKDLLALAVIDMKTRQRVLRSQLGCLTRLQGDAEEAIGIILKMFADDIAKYLADPRMLTQSGWRRFVAKEIKRFMGQFFYQDKEERQKTGGKLREAWLAQCKSKVYGLSLSLPNLEPLLKAGNKRAAVDALEKGAKHILKLGLIFERRHGQAVDEAEYLSKFKTLLDEFQQLR